MTAPIVLPPIKAAGFDLIWFGVIITIVMEMGPHTPACRPQPLRDQEHRAGYPAVRGDVGNAPFVALMAVAIVLICLFPGIAMLLPSVIK